MISPAHSLDAHSHSPPISRRPRRSRRRSQPGSRSDNARSIMHGDRSSFGESHSVSRWVAHKLRRLGHKFESSFCNLADKIDGTQASRSGEEGGRSGNSSRRSHMHDRQHRHSHHSTQNDSQEKNPTRSVKERRGHRRPPSSREALSAWDHMRKSGLATEPALPPLIGFDSTTGQSTEKSIAPQQAANTIVDPEQEAGGTTSDKRRTVRFSKVPEEPVAKETRREERKSSQPSVCPLIYRK